ncbi:hypothetical protein [Ignavigranum ruoffiae]|uniref:hypothetical protein n=1 Tax=Ignavigranum ruoffiae TaxID=89093 RepID=UPI002355FC76|nr:hypothetical protein [Ignavigranum ruoffiae]
MIRERKRLIDINHQIENLIHLYHDGDKENAEMSSRVRERLMEMRAYINREDDKLFYKQLKQKIKRDCTVEYLTEVKYLEKEDKYTLHFFTRGDLIVLIYVYGFGKQAENYWQNEATLKEAIKVALENNSYKVK